MNGSLDRSSKFWVCSPEDKWQRRVTSKHLFVQVLRRPSHHPPAAKAICQPLPLKCAPPRESLWLAVPENEGHFLLWRYSSWVTSVWPQSEWLWGMLRNDKSLFTSPSPYLGLSAYTALQALCHTTLSFESPNQEETPAGKKKHLSYWVWEWYIAWSEARRLTLQQGKRGRGEGKEGVLWREFPLRNRTILGGESSALTGGSVHGDKDRLGGGCMTPSHMQSGMRLK